MTDAIRLAAFPLGYGLVGALAGGTLNRIMVAEKGLPVTLVGFLFALPLLEAPLRVWLGYRSDGYPLFGRRREPYIVAGALLAGLGLALSVVLITGTAEGGMTLMGGLVLLFILYGFGRNLGHNAFQALVADRFAGSLRSRALTLYEVATMLGLVFGAGALGAALRDYTPAKLLGASVAVVTVAFGLALLGALGQERRSARVEIAAARAKATPFAEALSTLLLGDRQVLLFFALVVFTFVGTLAQDVLLEPYGALVLDMTVSETSQLTAFWGLGVLTAMLLSGTFLLRVMGHMRLLRIGLVSTLLVFLGVIATGATGSVALFRALVVVMGLGTGLAGAGMLGGIATFTTAIRAGLLMGVWGMAALLGKALGSILGGGVVDAMLLVTGSTVYVAYGTVFFLEGIMLFIALLISFRLRVDASRASAEAKAAAG
ncbi:MAG: MFS transporter [Gammaproteobacteria bacterium]|nr:MFS transporter [Gammaproteobacteria bacterium]